MRKESAETVAAGQNGLITRVQALALGLTAKQIDGRVGSGSWIRVHRGVYRMAAAPTSPAQRLLAAVLAVGPGTLASHRSAAWLWDMTDDLYLDLVGPMQRSPGPGITVHRRPPSDLRAVVRRGIPCTDPLRTMLDLAASGDRSSVDHGLDRGIATGLFSVTAVAAELGRRAAPGRRGVRLLRSCLLERLDGEGGQTSDLESAMDRLIVRYRLPPPVRQYRLPGTRYRLDYAWPDVRVLVEIDGYENHSALEVFRRDRTRQNALVLAGWTVLRFTSPDVRRHSAIVAGQILEALDAR